MGGFVKVAGKSRSPALHTVVGARRARRRCDRDLIGIFCLHAAAPAILHVAVMENAGEAAIRRAPAWLFPLYLALIDLFVVSVAIGGSITRSAFSQAGYSLA
jgi:hypothetical protein